MDRPVARKRFSAVGSPPVAIKRLPDYTVTSLSFDRLAYGSAVAWLLTLLACASQDSGAPGPAGPATGGSAGSGGSADGGGGTAVSTPLDYGAGSWQLENLTNTPAASEGSGPIAFLPGSVVVGWVEQAVNYSTVHAGIVGAVEALQAGDDGAWGPALAVIDGTALVVYTSRTSGRSDVYLAGGPGFAAVPLTDARDGSLGNGEASIAVGATGVVAVAYGSTLDGGSEVRVMQWSSMPRGAAIPESVVAGAGAYVESCVAVDHDGKIHVLLVSGEPGARRLYHANNRPGAWTSEAIDGAAGYLSTPRLAISPDGGTLVAAWEGVADGNSALQWSKRSLEGGGWRLPSMVEYKGYWPVLAIDPAGRAMVAFDDTSDMFVSWTDAPVGMDDVAFRPPVQVTADGMGPNWQAGGIAFDPAIRTPSFTFTLSPPQLDSEVYRAVFVPAP